MGLLNPASRPKAQADTGKRDRAKHGDELEGDGVGEHDRERGDEQGGKREVEDVQREALEPLGVPPRDASLGQQVVNEEVRRHDVAGVVAADVHVRAEYKVWSQLPDDKDRRSDYSDEPEGSCDHLAAVGRTVSPMACTAAIYIRAAPWWLHPSDSDAQKGVARW